MKTYDCFLFFDELEVLELRLKTLDPVVDYFVLVEAPWTFSGKPKPLYYHDNPGPFAKWAPKIRNIVLTGTLDTHDGRLGAWHREFASRNAMTAGFQDAAPDNLIFQSDCDEIWRPESKFTQLDEQSVTTYLQTLCYFHLNAVREPRIDWHGTRRVRAGDWPGGQNLRRMKGATLQNGGWHFSFLGDAEAARSKMKAFSHTEYSGDEYSGLDKLERDIADGADPINPEARYVPIPVDDTFPKPLLEEPWRWARHIRPA